MARGAYITNPPTYGAVTVASKTQVVSVTCSWDYNGADDHIRIGFYVNTDNPPTGTIYWYDTATGTSPGYWRDGYEYAGTGPETMACDGGAVGSLLRHPALVCDTTHYARSVVDYWADYDETSKTTRTSSIITFKTYPIPFTCAAPTASAVTHNSATVSATYYPNTVESVASVSIQYKKSTDSIWTTAATYTGQSGYSGVPKSVGLTGLSGSTLYKIRVTATRNTTSDTTFTSSEGSFTTSPGEPNVVIKPATSVGYAAATLNCWVYGDLLPVDVTFEWDTDSGAPYANETSPATTVSSVTGSGYTEVPKAITGLTVSTPYYFRAKVVYNGGADTLYTSELSFSTTADPGDIAKETEMLPIQDFDRKYGVATTLFFVVPQSGEDSSDLFFTSAAPWATGETKITKITYDDDSTPTVSGPSNTASNPAQVSGALYRLDISAAELQCDEAFVTLASPGGLGEPREIMLRVRTHLQLGSAIIDAATGQRANTSALSLVGYGSGHGLYAAGGATGNDIDAIPSTQFLRVATVGADGSGTSQQLDASASGSDDYYNGSILAIISGDGAGQARIITDYTGSSKVATIDEAWTVNPTISGASIFGIVPGARPWEQTILDELASVPSFTGAKYGEMLQLLFQRFAFKISQNGTTQVWYDSAGSTFASRTVGDTGTEQTVDALS